MAKTNRHILLSDIMPISHPGGFGRLCCSTRAVEYFPIVGGGLFGRIVYHVIQLDSVGNSLGSAVVEVKLVLALFHCRHSAYTKIGFSLKSGFRLSIPKLDLVLNRDSRK